MPTFGGEPIPNINQHESAHYPQMDRVKSTHFTGSDLANSEGKLQECPK